MKHHDKKTAFVSFLREHQAALRSFVRMLGVPHDSVDDLAQDVFLTAYRELDRFDVDRDIGKWLRGIARNSVRNELRKNARRKKIQHESLTDHLIAMAEENSSTTLVPFCDKSHRLALNVCLEELPEKSLLLVKGYYVEESASGILAQQYSMSAGAVRLALMRIRTRLKNCIQARVKHVQ